MMWVRRREDWWLVKLGDRVKMEEEVKITNEMVAF
jgi:hypothetical protein